MGQPSGVVHYLDDFLFCGTCGTSQCACFMTSFQEMTKELGVPLAEEKTEGLCQVLTFLGTELDTI